MLVTCQPVTLTCTYTPTSLSGHPSLQAQMVALEQNPSVAQQESEEQQRRELQQEVERLRSAQVQTERTLEARERAHLQKVRGLEEQVGRCCLWGRWGRRDCRGRGLAMT